MTDMPVDEDEDADTDSDDRTERTAMTKGSWRHSKIFGSERTGMSKISQQSKRRLQLDGFGEKGEVGSLTV